jgi:hypothetical protein
MSRGRADCAPQRLITGYRRGTEAPGPALFQCRIQLPRIDHLARTATFESCHALNSRRMRAGWTTLYASTPRAAAEAE